MLFSLVVALARPAFADEPAQASEETKPEPAEVPEETEPVEAQEEAEPAPISEVVPEWEVRQVRTCIDIAYILHQPAKLELGQWLRVGYTRRWNPGFAEHRASLGAGLNTTWQVGSIGHEEVRLGPFVGIESPLDRFRAEGGAEFALQRVDQMKDWTSSALALGAGVDDRGVPHGVATLSFGLRYVKARHSEYGACGDGPEPPASFGLASSLRLFVTYRQELREQAVRGLSAGLELGIPMLRRLAPPYTCHARLP